jgi:hypothetical protein
MSRLLHGWGWLLLAIGCTSTGVGNPGTATVSLSLTSDSEVEPEADDAEQLPASNLRHAILVFGSISFLACEDSAQDVTIKEPLTVDLAKSRTLPKTMSVEAPEGGFCGIDATLAPAETPATLAGQSVFFSGLRSDGTLFMLYANMAGTLHMRPLGDEDWASEPEHGWLFAMRPRRWLTPSELDGEPVNEIDRVIAIDASQHPRLYAAIRARLGARSTLHLDLDDDGELDANERRGAALIGQGLDSLE